MRVAVNLIMQTTMALAITAPIAMCGQKGETQSAVHADMAVEWSEEEGKMVFALVAPSLGWLTIGFDDDNSIEGAYLIMARVRSGKTEVVEHFTSSPGEYRPITELGGKALVEDIEGREEGGKTYVSFSLPLGEKTEYQKALQVGGEYFLIIAYSRDDDFQHHSITRTSIQIKL